MTAPPLRSRASLRRLDGRTKLRHAPPHMGNGDLCRDRVCSDLTSSLPSGLVTRVRLGFSEALACEPPALIAALHSLDAKGRFSTSWLDGEALGVSVRAGAGV